MTSPTGDTSELASALQAYVAACSGPGITLYEGHPAVLMAKAKLALTTLERELEEARAGRAIWLREYSNARKDRDSLFTASQAEVEKLREAMLDMVNRAKNHIAASAYAENQNEFNAGYKGAAEAIHLEVDYVARAALHPKVKP